jgi:hypothetical protein
MTAPIADLAALSERLAAVTGPDATLKQRVAVCSIVGSSLDLGGLADAIRGGSGSSSSSSGDGDGGGISTASAAAIQQTAVALALAQLDNAAGISDSQVRSFVLTALLPSVTTLAADDPPAASQLAAAAAAQLRSRGLWDTAAALLAAAAAHLAGTDAAAQGGSPEGAGGGEERAAVASLPVHTCGVLASELVAAAAATAAADSGGSGSDGGGPVKVLLLAAGDPLLPAALDCLAAPDGVRRRAALQQLLPAALDAAKQLGGEATVAALRTIWRRCGRMLLEGGAARRMALAALLQHADCWAPTLPAGAGFPEDAGSNGGGETTEGGSGKLAISHEESEAFWSSLRACLSDMEPLNRKRALRLLQALLPPDAGARQPAWAVWLGVFDALEEFAAHLQTATWHLVGGVHGLLTSLRVAA